MTTFEKIQERLLEKIDSNPNFIRALTEKEHRFLTQEICDKVLEKDKKFFRYIPQQFINKEIAESAVVAYPENINYLPEKYITDKLLNAFYSSLNPENMYNVLNNEGIGETASQDTKIKTLRFAIKAAISSPIDGVRTSEDECIKTAQKLLKSCDDINLLIDACDGLNFDAIGKMLIFNNVKKDFEKEIRIFLDKGRMALEEYREKIKDNSNFVYTSEGRILIDQYVDAILAGRHIDAIEDVTSFDMEFYYDVSGDDMALIHINDEDYTITYNYDKIKTVAKGNHIDLTRMSQTFDPNDAIVLSEYDIIQQVRIISEFNELLEQTKGNFEFLYARTEQDPFGTNLHESLTTILFRQGKNYYEYQQLDTATESSFQINEADPMGFTNLKGTDKTVTISELFEKTNIDIMKKFAQNFKESFVEIKQPNQEIR